MSSDFSQALNMWFVSFYLLSSTFLFLFVSMWSTHVCTCCRRACLGVCVHVETKDQGQASSLTSSALFP